MLDFLENWKEANLKFPVTYPKNKPMKVISSDGRFVYYDNQENKWKDWWTKEAVTIKHWIYPPRFSEHCDECPFNGKMCPSPVTYESSFGMTTNEYLIAKETGVYNCNNILLNLLKDEWMKAINEKLSEIPEENKIKEAN